MIWDSGGSKSRLAKAAGAEPAGQMRDEQLHAVVARSTFRSHYPGKRPQTVWRNGRIMYDDDDEEEEEINAADHRWGWWGAGGWRRVMKRMMMLMLRKMRWGLMMLRMEDDDVENDDVEEEEEDDEVEDGDWCWGGGPIPRPGPTLCGSLRSRNALEHSTRAILCENLQVKCHRPRPGTKPGPHCVRACVAEMHLGISQEPLYARIYPQVKWPQTSWSTLIKHRPLHLP